MSYAGTLLWFAADKNYGFAQCDDWEHEVLVHGSSVKLGQLEDMCEGTQVSFDIIFDANENCVRASNVIILEPGLHRKILLQELSMGRERGHDVRYMPY